MMRADEAYRMTNDKVEMAFRNRWEVVEKYSNEVIGPEILEAIENSQYETTVVVDEEINMGDLMIVIIAAGYKVKDVDERLLFISWAK